MPKSITESVIEKDIQGLAEQKKILEIQVESISKNLESLKLEKEVASKTLTTLKSEFEATKQAISTEKAKIIPTEVIDGLKNTKGELESQLKALQEAIDSKTTQLLDKEQKVAEIENKALVKKEEFKKSHASMISEMQAEIDAKIADQNELNSKLDTLAIQIGEKSVQLEALADEFSKYEGITEKVEDMERLDSDMGIRIVKKEAIIESLEQKNRDLVFELATHQKKMDSEVERLNDREGALSFRETMLKNKEDLLMNFIDYLQQKYNDPSLKPYYEKFIAKK